MNEPQPRRRRPLSLQRALFSVVLYSVLTYFLAQARPRTIITTIGELAAAMAVALYVYLIGAKLIAQRKSQI